VIDDLEDFENIPPPPQSEFDRDAEFALASPGLDEEERDAIIRQARSLAASGLAREALGNWICREVARTVGARSGFRGVDAEGNEIDPPDIRAARREMRSEAGKKRQSKRNSALRLWQQRYWEMIDAGRSQAETWEACWAAIHGLHRKANNQFVAATAVAPEFQGLPVIYGRDGKSPPKNKKRFRARFASRPSVH
jgi:hypothetical protein